MKRINKEYANEELKKTFEMFGIECEESCYLGFVEATKGVVTINTHPRLKFCDNKELVYELTFSCGLRECGTYTSDEMQKLAKRMQLISCVAHRLNETFKNVAVTEEVIKD